MTRVIAYGKIGRSWNLDPKKASTVGGDLDVQRGLMRLATQFPDDAIVLLGRNSGENPFTLGYPANVINPWAYSIYSPEPWKLPSVKDFSTFITRWRSMSDMLIEGEERHRVTHIVLWVGQHGSSNIPIPQIGYDWDAGNLTNPQISALNYGSYLLDFVNRSGLEPVLLIPDPRNYLKCRDLKNPLIRPLLAQYRMQREMKHERYGDFEHITKMGRREQSVFVTTAEYEYAGIELTALDAPAAISCSTNMDRPHRFGLISNENRITKGRFDRLPLVREWVMRAMPAAPIFGAWSEASEQILGRKIASVDALDMVPTLQSFMATLTLPASASGWATAKPWEAFAAGTPIFFHPRYDEQGHILPLRLSQTWASTVPVARELAQFLRVRTPDELARKVHDLEVNPALWQSIVQQQRAYFELAYQHWNGGVARIAEEIRAR